MNGRRRIPKGQYLYYLKHRDGRPLEYEVGESAQDAVRRHGWIQGEVKRWMSVGFGKEILPMSEDTKAYLKQYRDERKGLRRIRP